MLVTFRYFDAADEWGLLISPELPCVYGGYFRAANATGQELYLASWAAYIAARRNHPSILVWTLCNEMSVLNIVMFKCLPPCARKDGAQSALRVCIDTGCADLLLVVLQVHGRSVQSGWYNVRG